MKKGSKFLRRKGSASELTSLRLLDWSDELKEGEQVMVKVINIDPSGKIRLSRKVLIAPPSPEEGQAAGAKGGKPSGRDRE